MIDPDELQWRDYAATLDSVRNLGEIRFKLLALIPTVSGFAVAVTSANLDRLHQQPAMGIVVGLLGFVVTLGLIFYDQRNSQLYDALGARLLGLEKLLWPGEGGQWSERPSRRRMFGTIRIWHDRALALIYGSVIGTWAFPTIASVLWQARAERMISVVRTSALISVLISIVMIRELHRLAESPLKRATSDPAPKTMQASPKR